MSALENQTCEKSALLFLFAIATSVFLSFVGSFVFFDYFSVCLIFNPLASFGCGSEVNNERKK